MLHVHVEHCSFVIGFRQLPTSIKVGLVHHFIHKQIYVPCTV